MRNLKKLETENVRKLLFKFAVPAMSGMLLNALYNIVDRIYIGRGVGPMAISGLSATMPVMTIVIAFALLAGLGGATLVSLRLGEKKREEAEQILGNTFILLILLSILFTVAGTVFIKPILFAFGASELTYPYAKEYMSIIFLGSAFPIIGLGMNHSIRAAGDPKTSMYTQLIGAILNIALDPVFIFGFKMGIAGAAWATVISQSVSFIWVMRYLFKGKGGLKLSSKNIRLKSIYVKMIFALGLNSFLNQILQSAVLGLTNRQLYAYGGDISVGAMAAVSSVTMLLVMLVIGLIQGMQPIVGYNYGAGLYKRAKHTLYTAAVAATVICTIGWVMTRIFPAQIVAIFNNDPDFISVASFGLFADMLLFPTVGAQICASSYFQAIGKAKQSIFLVLLRQIILLIPLIIILPRVFGLAGVWYSYPATDLIAFIVTAFFIYRELRLYRVQGTAQSDGEAPLDFPNPG